MHLERRLLAVGSAIVVALSAHGVAAAEPESSANARDNASFMRHLRIDTGGGGPAADGNNPAFGGYQLLGADTSVEATIIVPPVSCDRQEGAARVRPGFSDAAVIPSALAVLDRRVIGGAGVVAACDFQGDEGPGREVYAGVLYEGERNSSVVRSAVSPGDVVRASYAVDAETGMATSTLENVTQGWVETSEPFADTPGWIAQIGDRKVRFDLGPGIRNYLALPDFGVNRIEDAAVDGVTVAPGSSDRITMVTPIGGSEQVLPSQIGTGDFTLTRVL